MDPSTPTAQDVQNQTPASQSANSVEPPVTATPLVQPVPTQPKMPISVPGNVEEGSAVIMQENPDVDTDEEDEIKVAPQETKNQAVSQSAGFDEQEVAQIQPAVPEVVTSSPEVEKFVEITPPDVPKLSEEIKNAGVTHSGLGIIDVSQANFAPAKIPVTYERAVVEEKQTQLHDSKHWLMGKIMYIWRKLNPKIALSVKKSPAPVLPNPVKTNQIPVKENTNTL